MAFLTNIIQDDISEIISILGKDIFKLEGKNIIITGANGMIGSYLTQTILQANKSLFKKPAELYLVTRSGHKKFGEQKFIHYVTSDVTKELLLPKMHFLIHAASKAAPKLYTQNMIDTLNTNILGMYVLLKLCDRNTESFLFISSAEIYGNVPNKPVKESFIGRIDHTNKRSCYVEAKKASETIALNYYWEKQIPVKVARIFHTFGPGLNLLDGRVFSDFLKFGLEKKDVVISGDPTMKRSLLYVKDAAIMLFKILLSNRNGEIYNVGSTNSVSIKKFAEIVSSTFNSMYKADRKVRILKNPKMSYFKNAVKSIRPSLTKFKKDFGYSPKTKINITVERTIRHFIELSKKSNLL